MNDIHSDLVGLRNKLARSVEEAEKRRDLLSKQIDKDRALLHAINSSLAIKVAQSTGPGGFAGVVKTAVKDLGKDQFTPNDVERAMIENHPTVLISKEGIRTALWNMLHKGEIKSVRKGNNQQPALYARAKAFQ